MSWVNEYVNNNKTNFKDVILVGPFKKKHYKGIEWASVEVPDFLPPFLPKPIAIELNPY